MASISKEDFKVLLRNGRQYDIPSPTSSDAGKVLKVVNGKSQWVNP